MALGLCDADKFALVRLEGTTFRGRPATKQNVAQGAKVGDSPRCAPATHVAIPPADALGGNRVSEARGLAV